MKFFIETLGCKVNMYESVYIKEDLLKNGFIESDKLEGADIVIINTCTVTNQADSKSRKLIRQAKRVNPNCILVVCGCSAQHHKNDLLELDIDILLGTDGKSKIRNLIEEFIKNKETISLFNDVRKVEFEDMKVNEMEGRTRAFVKIQDGCNNFCSYCIIPFMRGNIRSKNIDDAVKEINELADSGFKEIVLTGIHTGSYGNGEDFDLVDLIQEISKNDNLKRIRISSIEITELDEKFMNELKKNPKICSHFHVPVQCPNDKILKLMNRKYVLDEYKDKIEELRAIRDDMNITTDLIVGFPGETDSIFSSMLDECVNIGFSKIHTFPYSMRTGTKASLMEQVKDSDKKDRVDKMLRMSDMLESNYYKKYIGKIVEVLVEDGYSGFTSNYIKVHFDKLCEHNTFVNVKITEVDGINVKGKIL